MGAFRPPADAWSRRDFMRNGSYSIALVCTFGTDLVAQGPEGHEVRPRPRGARRPLAVHAVPARPADRARRSRPSRPRTASMSTTSTSRRAWPRSCPASRRRSTATRASTPGRRSAPARAARRSCASATSCRSTPTCTSTAATSRRRTTATRWTSSSPARVRLHVPERAGRGVPLVPRPRPRAHGAHALLRPGRHVPAAATSARRSSSCRRASTTSRSCSPTTRSTRTARSATPRTSTSASAATRCWSTARSRRGWPVQRRIYRLRFLNASNARSYELKLGNGRQMLQIASDGGLLEAPVARSSFPLHPAERIEVLIDFRALQAGLGDRAAERRRRGGGTRAGHALRRRRRRRRRGGADAARAHAHAREAAGAQRDPPLGPLAADAGRACSGRSPTAASTPTASTSRRGSGSTELWQWHNPSNRVHPMHLHGMLFRVVERSSGVIHPGERGWKDTVGVLPGETVTVQPWFIPYAGRYVFHCHSLEHGDKAMMLQLEVVQVRLRICGSPRGLALRRVASPAPAEHDQVVHRHRHARAGTSRSRSISPGDTVAWTFAGHGRRSHNVGRERPATGRRLGVVRVATPAPAADAPYTFESVGTYSFFCAVHQDTMLGDGHAWPRPAAAAAAAAAAEPAAVRQRRRRPVRRPRPRSRSTRPSRGSRSVSVKRASKGARGALQGLRGRPSIGVVVLARQEDRQERTRSAGKGTLAFTARACGPARYTVTLVPCDRSRATSPRPRTLRVTVR